MYITKFELLGFSPQFSDTAHTTQIVATANAIAFSYLQRKILKAQYTQKITRRNELLKDKPLLRVPSPVLINDSTGEQVLLSERDFLNGENGRIHIDTATTTTYTCTYTAGVDVIPDDIKTAVMFICDYLLTKVRSGGRETTEYENYETATYTSMPYYIIELLKPHRMSNATRLLI